MRIPSPAKAALAARRSTATAPGAPPRRGPASSATARAAAATVAVAKPVTSKTDGSTRAGRAGHGEVVEHARRSVQGRPDGREQRRSVRIDGGGHADTCALTLGVVATLTINNNAPRAACERGMHRAMS